MNGTPPTNQAVIDAEHLKLLSIFHYVAAGLSAMFGTLPVLYMVIGLIVVLFGDKMGKGSDAPPAFVGWFFVAFGAIFTVIGWAHAILVFLTGRYLSKRTHHTFCFVIACVQCIFLPFGTILGIFTILVLSRPTVKAQFPQSAL